MIKFGLNLCKTEGISMPEFKEQPQEEPDNHEFDLDFDLSACLSNEETLSPEDVIAAADAMAKREEAKMDVLHSTLAEFTGQQKPPLPDASTRAVPYIKQIENSYDTTRENETSWELDKAKQLAKSHGVNLSEIYSNDDLYTELQTTLHTPETFAGSFTHTLHHMSSEDYENSVAMKMIDRSLPKEGLSEEQISELTLAFQLDPNVQSQIKGRIEAYREATRQVFVCEATQYWGDGVLEQLTEEKRKILTPRQPLALNIVEKLNRL
jgi:hypothetical protein